MLRVPYLAATLLVLTACQPPPTQKGPSKIVTLGAVIDRTGSSAGPSWSDALALAESNFNDALASVSATADVGVRLLINDSVNDPTVALPRALALVREEGAKGVITDTSQNDIALNSTFYDADTTNDLGVPLMCTGCGSGSINNPTATNADPVTQQALRNEQKWNFRAASSTKLMALVIARQLLQAGTDGDVNGDGVVKYSLYGSDESFGKTTSRDVAAAVAQLRPSPAPLIEQLVHPVVLDPSSYDFDADLKKLVDAYNETTMMPDRAPDAIVIATFAQYDTAFVKAYRLGGYTTKVMHVHTFRINSSILSLGAQAEGQEGVSQVVLDGASGDVFAAEFQKKFSTAPVYRDSTYYDAAISLMLASVIGSQGMDDPSQLSGEQLRAAMSKTSDPAGEAVGPGPTDLARAIGLIREGKAINYTGASGPMDFDANGNVRNKLALYRATGGVFVDVQKFDCIANDQCAAIP